MASIHSLPHLFIMHSISHQPMECDEPLDSTEQELAALEHKEPSSTDPSRNLGDTFKEHPLFATIETVTVVTKAVFKTPPSPSTSDHSSANTSPAYSNGYASPYRKRVFSEEAPRCHQRIRTEPDQTVPDSPIPMD